MDVRDSWTVTVGAATVLLLLGVAPQADRRAASASSAGPKHAGINVGNVIETVSHRVTRSRGLFSARDPRYRVRFDARGIRLDLRGRSGSHFRLDTIGVGGGRVELVRSPWRAYLNTASREIAPGLVERVTAQEGQLEWDFVLRRPPRSEEDVRIEAVVGSAARPIRARHAWRWAAGEGRSVRMGELVVKDAGGKTLYRALPKVGRTLLLSVPRRALAGARYPVTLDPVVSPEYPSSDPVYWSASASQVPRAVASNGSDYLVVWQDERPGYYQQPWRVYAARVSSGGAILDPGGIPIARAGTSSPAVAWTGGHYLVVWEEASNVSGARVSSGGAVLDPTGFPITAASDYESSPAVAFDGTNSLVTWYSRPPVWMGTAEIRGARVNGAGVVLDDPIPIATASGNKGYQGVAWNGSEYLVAWTDLRSGSPAVYGARLAADGAVLDGGGILIAADAVLWGALEVASNGSDFLVAWQQGTDAHGARVRSDGVVLDQPPIVISSAQSSQVPSDVAWDGTNYVVIWIDSRNESSGNGNSDVYAARVTASGGVLDPNGIPIVIEPYRQSYGSLAWNGSRYLITWSDYRSLAGDDVFGGRMTADGSLLDGSGFLVSSAANAQFEGAIASDGTNYFVVWEDFRGVSGIYGARVTPDGTILDGTGVVISNTGNPEDPTVGWNGSNYWVAWQRSAGGNNDVYGARVSSTGTVLDPQGVPIATSTGHEIDPAISSGQGDLLVTWERYTNWEAGEIDIHGARLSSTGAVLDPDGIPIRINPGPETNPAVASDGSGYLVVWSTVGPYNNGGTWHIYARRVTGAGIPLSPDPIVISERTARAPTVAWSGSTYLVAWEKLTEDSGWDIHATRVSGEGVRLDGDGFAVSRSSLQEYAPAVAWNGVNFVVAWQASGILAARVAGTGLVLDPAGISVAADPGNGLPAVAAGPYREVSIAYERFAPAAPYGGFRIFQRIFNDDWQPSLPPPRPVRCRVPRVVGLRLAKARTKIRKAHCAVGRVRRVRRPRRVGRVVSQSPRRGTTWRRGKKVTLVVGRRR